MLVVEVTCITTGATAATCGRFASTSATFTETDALLNAFIIDDPGGRTNTSAPMPYWRVYESLGMPSERPTICRIMLIVGLSQGMLKDSKTRQYGIGADVLVRPP